MTTIEAKCHACKGRGYAGPLGDTCGACEGSGIREEQRSRECRHCGARLIWRDERDTGECRPCNG